MCTCIMLYRSYKLDLDQIIKLLKESADDLKADNDKAEAKENGSANVLRSSDGRITPTTDEGARE